MIVDHNWATSCNIHAWHLQSNLFYNDIRYNDKIRYNDNLNGTSPKLKMRQIIRDI